MIKINYTKLLEVYGKFRARAYKEFDENERNEFFKFLEEQYDEILLNNSLIEKKFNEIKTA